MSSNSRFKYFVGSAILGGGLLLKLGAPIAAVAAGLLLALVVSYRLDQRSARSSR